MGIQDRDYYHERHRHHAGGSDRRDYSQRLREMEDAGQTVNIPGVRRRFRILDKVRAPVTHQPSPRQPANYSVAYLLLAVLLTALGYLVYKVSTFILS